MLAARRHPIAFMSVVMNLSMANVHMAMQNHWSKYDDSYVELHRGIGKTVQLSGRCAWEIGDNPNIRIKYVQQVKEKAVEVVRAVRRIIEMPVYSLIFPGVVPDDEDWGAESFSVKRDKWGRDSTMTAEGIMGRAGGRWDLLIADDICDLQNAIQKPAEREKVKESWATNWLPMADHARGKPRRWKVATPYHVSDITADWRNQHREDGSLLRIPVKNFCSPWREVFTPEVLRAERARMGPIAYARAYELQPVSTDLLIFPAEWLDRALFVEIPQEQTVRAQRIVAFDFAYTDKRIGVKKKGEPDWSVCLIGTKSANNHIYVEDMLRVQSSFPEFKRQAFALCQRWGVSSGTGEANGPQAGIVQQMNIDSPFPIVGVERKLDKVTRAAACQPFIESQRFHLRATSDHFGGMRPIAALQPLYDEMTTFPAGNHDDTVDAAIDLIGMAGMMRAPLKTEKIQPVRPRDRFSPNLSRIYG